MNKLDLYIIKRFLSTFLLALGLFTVIIVIFDISEKIDDYINKKVPVIEIIRDYYLNFVPFLLNFFSPIFVFISVVFFTAKMASNSEIVAILASGVSYVRLLRPYVITSVLLAIFSFILNSFVIPEADEKRMEFENTYIRDRSNDYKEGIRRQIRPGVIMSLGSFNYLDSFGYRLNLDQIENGRVVSKMYAEKLRWNKEQQTWEVVNYRIRNIQANGKENILRGEQMDTMIPFNPEDFFRRSDDVQSFNLFELNEYIELERVRGTGDIFFYQTEKNRRISDPFSMIVLTVIGVCVSSIKTRGGIGLHLGKGLLISFTYLLIIQFFQSFGKTGTIPPALSVWIPNFAFMGVAFVLYRNTQK